MAPVLPDSLLQHSKEIYILYGCAYCHGVDLKVVNGEAADLLHSGSIAADENGNVIGRILRSGIPQTAKLSPMPQYSDLSDQEIADITTWIHYARRQGRYKELMETNLPPGSAVAGKSYFEKTCSSCHTRADAAGMTKKYNAPTLKANILNPAFLNVPQSFRVDSMRDAKAGAARQRHSVLLERYTAEDVSNLMAYLKDAK
jgi:mono/diheme cytochrome c family protein